MTALNLYMLISLSCLICFTETSRVDLFQRQLPRCECTHCGGLNCLIRDALLFDCVSAAASLPHQRHVDGHRHNCIIIMSIITLFIITMHDDMLDNNNKNENEKNERKK